MILLWTAHSSVCHMLRLSNVTTMEYVLIFPYQRYFDTSHAIELFFRIFCLSEGGRFRVGSNLS